MSCSVAPPHQRPRGMGGACASDCACAVPVRIHAGRVSVRSANSDASRFRACRAAGVRLCAHALLSVRAFRHLCQCVCCCRPVPVTQPSSPRPRRPSALLCALPDLSDSWQVLAFLRRCRASGEQLQDLGRRDGGAGSAGGASLHPPGGNAGGYAPCHQEGEWIQLGL